MADITKCNNTKCKIKDECYRYTCKGSDWQSYQNFEPKETDGKIGCEFFMESLPKIIDVAVIAASRKKFLEWVNENKSENERYTFVNKIQDTKGRSFHRYEKTYGWMYVPNWHEVETQCKNRITNPK